LAAKFGRELPEPVAVIFTGENITRDDFWELISS
jgi:hypothetical protein